MKIAVRDPETGFEWETVTNETGNYNLPGLRPANDDVTAELAGFRRRSQRGFKAEVNQTARLDIELEVCDPTFSHGERTRDTVSGNVIFFQWQLLLRAGRSLRHGGAIDGHRVGGKRGGSGPV